MNSEQPVRIELRLPGQKVRLDVDRAWSVIANATVPAVSVVAEAEKTSTIEFADNVTFTLSLPTGELGQFDTSEDCAAIRGNDFDLRVFDVAGLSITSIQTSLTQEGGVLATAYTPSERFSTSWPALERILASAVVLPAEAEGDDQ